MTRDLEHVYSEVEKELSNSGVTNVIVNIDVIKEHEGQAELVSSFLHNVSTQEDLEVLKLMLGALRPFVVEAEVHETW